jgi:chemotaxis protein MotB
MAIEEEPEPGIPEWVVTFGDMMSLLLTFFIMLVSMSELKQEEKFQAMVESMREQFGHDRSIASLIPGNIRPRNSAMEHVASQGRAKKKGVERGGQEQQAVTGDNKRVQIIRPGDDSSSGGVVYFEEGSAELSAANKVTLGQIIHQIKGKPQKIEIRGHTSRKPIDPKSGLQDHWDLSYTRCRSTMKFLVEQGIDPERIRLGPSGVNEPIYRGIDPSRLKKNSRVQILMWDERVENLEGA